MFIDDFSNLLPFVPLDAGNAPNYNYVTGSDETLTFIAGSTQAVELSCTTGTAFLAQANPPDVIHQSVEVRILHGVVGSGTHYSGAFARLIDTDNYVVLRYDHFNAILQLVQVIGGVETVLVEPPLVPDEDEPGFAIKLEVIGKRARYWLNPFFYDVPDEPPDGAIDLLEVSDSPGEWGILMQTTDTSPTFHVAGLRVRELPSVALPQPDVDADVAADYSFAPVTVSVTTVPSDTLYLEWQACPVDDEDFSETYNDVGIGSLQSRILWLRKGYTYDVRARALTVLGEHTDWTTPSRVTVTGTKVSPDPPTFPDEEFPDITPDYVLERTQSAEVSAVISDTQRERLTSPWSRPRNSWTLRFENRLTDEVQQILDFFDRMQGMLTAFKWVHPTTADQFAVRFDTDELDRNVVDEGEDGALISIEVPIIEVVVGAVGTLSVTLELDPALYS